MNDRPTRTDLEHLQRQIDAIKARLARLEASEEVELAPRVKRLEALVTRLLSGPPSILPRIPRGEE